MNKPIHIILTCVLASIAVLGAAASDKADLDQLVAETHKASLKLREEPDNAVSTQRIAAALKPVQSTPAAFDPKRIDWADRLALLLLYKNENVEAANRLVLAYCGADPIEHYARQGDPIGHRVFSSFCKKNMGLLKHLFDLLRDGDDNAQRVLLSWLNRRSYSDVRFPGYRG